MQHFMEYLKVRSRLPGAHIKYYATTWNRYKSPCLGLTFSCKELLDTELGGEGEQDRLQPGELHRPVVTAVTRQQVGGEVGGGAACRLITYLLH